MNFQPLLEGFYRRLLVLYPARFRDLYQEEMAEGACTWFTRWMSQGMK